MTAVQPQQAFGVQKSMKLADDKAELASIAQKQENADAAKQLKTHKQQPTLESMPNTEGDPGPPTSAPDAGPKSGQAAGQSKPANVRKVDNPEVCFPLSMLSLMLFGFSHL